MNFGLLDFLVLFFALILIGLIQGGVALGTMYLLHQDRSLRELLLRWVLIAVPVTILFAIMTAIMSEHPGRQLPPMFFTVALSFAAIPGIYRLKPFIHESTYGNFDFRAFERGAFNELMVRLAAIFLPLTLVLHILVYLFIAKRIYRYTIPISFALWVLETAGIAAGFVYILRIEKERTILLTVISSMFYIAVIWYLVVEGMFS